MRAATERIHNGFLRLIICAVGIVLIQLVDKLLAVQSFAPQLLKTPGKSELMCFPFISVFVI